MGQLFQDAQQSIESEGQLLDTFMEPVSSEQLGSYENCDPTLRESYYNRGLQEISKGTVAVLIMAGGQGTRLGVSYPKGMYSVDLLSNKSLFQLQAERIQKVQQIANEKFNGNGKITWYIMTSVPTYEATQKYLTENNYFNLEKENVVFFKQGLMPCFDFDGKILMDAKDKLAMAPDGNGGIYQALKISGILDDFQTRGIQNIHVHSVDNILTKVADPTFIGYCIEKGSDCAAKVVKKSSPHEAVGVICKVKDKIQVVEYSEISQAQAESTNPDGSLIYNAGNICNHFFTADFLRKVANKDMQVHVAKKKIPYINDQAEIIKPSTPNGIKVEKFVFDVFQFSSHFVVWEVPRDTEFSALKNADSAGKDCPSTARRDLYRLHKKYLEEVKAIVVGDEVEICPLLSYAGEGLEQYSGKQINSPMHLV